MPAEEKTYILSCDITSFMRRGHIYGKKGEAVRIIREGDICAVQSLTTGNKFSARNSLLIEKTVK